MKRLILVLASVITAIPLIAVGKKQPQEWRFDVNQPVTEVERVLDSKVKVKIRLEFGENSDEAVRRGWDHLEDADGSSWIGDQSRVSFVWKFPLKRTSIWINGELQSIPYEALAEEGDIGSCQVHSTPHKVEIKLYGGDAGAAYEIELHFIESKRMPGKWTLARRIWRLGEFSDTEWDETIYHSNNWDDPDM